MSMIEKTPACEYEAVLRYFQGNGWRVERQQPGRRDAMLCRPRSGLRGGLARLLGLRGMQCQRVWVERDGYVHNEWV